MEGKQVTELDALPSFTDTSLVPVHNGAGLKKGLLSQLASYLGTKFSNPNLLINPDFKINQRGSTTYTTGYTVDRWKINSGTVKTSSSGITVTLNNKGQFIQQFGNTLSGTYTATIKVTSITGDCVLFIGSHSLQLNKAGTFTITENGSITGISLYKNTAGTCTINIEYIKLEQGSVSTPFIVPDYATELVKCQRYYVSRQLHFYGVCNVDTILNEDLQYLPPMRINPTFTKNIEYSKNIVTSSIVFYGDIVKGHYLYFKSTTSSSSSQYILGITINADAEIY